MKYKKGNWAAETSGDDKVIYVTGPAEMKIEIDHDDVDHKEVEKDTKLLVDLLANHWHT